MPAGGWGGSGARVLRRRLQRGSPTAFSPGRASGTGEPGRGRRRRPRLRSCDPLAAPLLLSGRPPEESRPPAAAAAPPPTRGPTPRRWPRPPAPAVASLGRAAHVGPRPGDLRRGAMASESVKVVVRCRPMNQRERELNCQPVVTVDSARGQCFIQNPGAADEPPKQFTFDGAYYVDHFTEQIYNEIAYPLVEVRAPGGPPPGTGQAELGATSGGLKGWH